MSVMWWASTCHDGADEEEHTEEDVSGQCAEVIEDFALNDGECNSKYLRTTEISWACMSCTINMLLTLYNSASS